MRKVGIDTCFVDRMKPKIILHCGAPKTGSTTFQHLLYANSDTLLKAGFYCPVVSRKRRVKDDIRLLLGEMLRSGNGGQAYLDHIHAVIAQIVRDTGAHTLIVSHEGLLGKPFAPKTKGFYPRAEESAAAIADALKGYDIEARMVVRDYCGFLPSWYVQYVRMGGMLSFEAFQSYYDFDSVTWKTPVTALRAHFGDRAGIYEFSDMVRDPYGFLCALYPDIMAALGENGRRMPSKNIAIGRGMVEVYRRWNAIAEKVAGGGSRRKTLQHIGRRYVLLPFERFSNSEKLRLPAETAARMSARYQADLAAIAPRRVGAPDGG
jgi:hypothetical protein